MAEWSCSKLVSASTAAATAGSARNSSQDLYGFAIELRKLAYTMPGGHEDPLIRLSQRMGRHAQQQADEKSPPRRLAN